MTQLEPIAKGMVMRKGFLGSACMVFAGASIALAQASVPESSLPATPSSGMAKFGNAQPSPSSGVMEDRSAAGASSGSPLRFWASAEYLLWWTKGASLPPLVTTGPALPLSPSPGSFAAPGTVVLFGGDEPNRNPFSGGRFTLGFWCNDCQTIGAEATFFFLGRRSNDFNAATSGEPGSIVLARPFFDTSTGTFNSELVGFPGLAAGSINVHSTSSLLGAEGNLLFNLCCSCDTSCETTCDPCDKPARRYRVDLLAGLRYMELREGLVIAENTQVAANSPIFAATNISAFDQFDTVNRFYGAQLGIRSEWWWNRLFIDATAKVALGVTHQTVDINGSTRITTPGGATTVLPGNLLAQPSNIGHYSRDQFSVVPELGMNLGYQLLRNLDLFVGYTIIYWTNVQRPGDAISTQINSTRVPLSTVAPSGPIDPRFNFHNSNFWTQGINFGVQLRF
jgi:Putative beta barrel porin-7 (BBP7)